MQEQVTFKATHSKLTGLPNEKVFIKKLEESLKNTRLNNSEHVLCYIQFDEFDKIVKQTGGKLADGLLKSYAGVLEKYFSTYGYIGQIDKTSFAVLVENKKLETGTQIADKHRYSIFKSRVKWKGDTLPISISIGNVLLDRHSQQAEVELKSALIACRKASSDGGNRTQQYLPGTAHLIAKDSVDWTTAIPRALEENKVALFRQQIVPINGDETKAGHYEILFRLIDLEGNALAPFQFIQAAERTGHMPMVDRWIIKNTLKWMTDNPELLKEVSGYAINLSGLTLSDESLMSDVIKMLDESGVASEKILFEVTETVEIDSLSIAIEFIHALRKRGCRFCLDDFGTGLSSYAYLKQLPVDYVKIDGLFVKDILKNETDRAMVKSINEISHYMGKKTIAEFVENDEVVAVLKEIGIDYVQGFGIHKPSILPVP
jgi:diguanylate cyclase (GGDEF)-like protein